MNGADPKPVPPLGPGGFHSINPHQKLLPPPRVDWTKIDAYRKVRPC